jgi:hypothetical protein
MFGFTNKIIGLAGAIAATIGHRNVGKHDRLDGLGQVDRERHVGAMNISLLFQFGTSATDPTLQKSSPRRRRD